ncbi:MAG: nucleotidyltransferase [Polyangiaceae bacterium]|nr:nucleotidyltransferase [Polyangiaceae bacterium]
MVESERGTMLEAVGRLARLLSEWGGPAAVVGGLGIVIRVRPRLTTDIDLVISVQPDDVDALLALAERHGWAHDPLELEGLVPGGLARLKAAGDGGFDLDLMFVDSVFLESVVARATPVALGGASLPVASVEDLLVMKLEAERPQDIDDILAIKDAFAEHLDWAYVRQHTDRLGLSDRLRLYFGGES